MRPPLHARVDGPACGAENMAADRALLDAVEEQPDHARLRIYAWSPNCVSIGFHQSESLLRLDRLRADGVDWVRRPTGGAAILHADEITFALAAPLPGPRSRRIAELYDPLAGAIVQALRDNDLDARCAGGAAPYAEACFASAGGHEILVGDRKICGIALRRGRRAYLAHGSLLITDAHRRLVDYLLLSERSLELGEPSTDLRREGLGNAAIQRVATSLFERLGATLRQKKSAA